MYWSVGFVFSFFWGFGFVVLVLGGNEWYFFYMVTTAVVYLYYLLLQREEMEMLIITLWQLLLKLSPYSDSHFSKI